MKKLVFGVCLLLITFSLFATDVSGNQSGTWNLAGSPYHIVGEITVPDGQTLTIDAGVEVIATGVYQITALGNIEAAGAVNDTIRFYGNGGLNWGGIRLEDEIDASHFAYCRISNTDDMNDYGIHSVNSPVFIDHCYIDDHQKGIQFSGLSSDNPSYMEITNSKIANVQKSGITVVDNSNVLIDNCEVTQCGLGTQFYGAIQLSLQSNSHSCSPTITNNYIHDNGKQGLTLANLFGYENMAPIVNYNEVCYNYTGIYLYSGKGTYSHNHIHHNYVENDPNSGAGVMLYGSIANAVFTYNEVDHNYTGFYLTAGATVNLGDLSNASTDDDGYNCIYDNIFYTGAEYTVYNASSADVVAENTVWDDDPPLDDTIIDGNDNPSYGIVDYEPTLTPLAPPDSIDVINEYECIPVGFAYPTYLEPISWNLYVNGILIGTFSLEVYYNLLPLLSPGENEILISYVYEDGESAYVVTEIWYNFILNPPQNVQVTPMGLMTWEAPEPGSTSTLLGYNIYLDDFTVPISTATSMSYQFTDLIYGQTYVAGVSAVYEDGESEIAIATWIPAIHNQPENAGYDLFPDHIHLYWEAPVGSNIDVEEYHIYVDGTMYSTTELFYDIYDLISGQEYEIALTVLYVDQIESEPIVLNILFVGNDDLLNAETKLLGNYPNPFNPSTTISFNLTAKDAENAKIEIFNIKGQKIRTLDGDNSVAEASGSCCTNAHSVVWNGTDDHGKSVSSGIYYYRLKAGEKTFTSKMLLMK
ncbi:MAG TPA: right-handed parallel beta-helix repeat-containing protein [Candidatus Cloacimonadota bacterium]|nr:right-handed parallel beta-helix repeat-containing protein [Candidatus Cloacimonadota bacterium]